MTRVNYLGSIVIAFALGGIGMWAIQGNYKPLLHHVLAQFANHQTQPSIQTLTPSVQSSHPGAQQSQAPQSGTPQPTTPNMLNQFGTTPLQAQANPFREIERMQKQMNQFFSQNGLFQNGFFGGNNFFSQNGAAHHGGLFSFGPGGMFGNMNSMFSNQAGNMGTTITQGQDSHSVYYKMKLGHNQDVSNVKVKVNNGYVSINAKLQNKSQNSFSASTVSEQFPVPAGVDPHSAKITKQGDSIVIRFNKV